MRSTLMVKRLGFQNTAPCSQLQLIINRVTDSVPNARPSFRGQFGVSHLREFVGNRIVSHDNKSRICSQKSLMFITFTINTTTPTSTIYTTFIPKSKNVLATGVIIAYHFITRLLKLLIAS